jgi:hypothetical protein
MVDEFLERKLLEDVEIAFALHLFVLLLRRRTALAASLDALCSHFSLFLYLSPMARRFVSRFNRAETAM